MWRASDPPTLTTESTRTNVMAIQRLWRGRPRGLRELPETIRENTKYEAGYWYLDRAVLSVNGLWMKLLFENGRTDYWRQVDGLWTPSLDGPSQFDLMTTADQYGQVADEPTLKNDPFA